jgi:outer membrane receptor protein involved in Fe transport
MRVFGNVCDRAGPRAFAYQEVNRMGSASASGRSTRLRACAWAIGVAFALLHAGGATAIAATTGKIQGKVVATDTGEPLGFADVVLLPADTTMHPVGGPTNADGTFLLEAPPGRYALKVRALSYAPKRIEGIVLQAGELLPLNTALTPEAIKVEEIVVEGEAGHNTEAGLLTARKKAASVGDAVSAEQVRRSPDKDAAEVLRRVTGLSVSDGKYVFVRGLGERYSSTEVDGVRIASPEQNKRVVPLDLLPVNLLDNIVVQKTYTADRPGEFGGGDVQVHTKDFPGRRTWSVSISQGYAEGETFKDRLTYPGSRADIFGFGSGARRLPDAVRNVGLPPAQGSKNLGTLANMARDFRDAWGTNSTRAIPNGSYSASYGDELKLFGRPLGLIESWSLTRSSSRQDEQQRFYEGDANAIKYDYAVTRWTESAQLGGISALSYRLSPRHTLHLRGLYTNNADDEVRTYEGLDYNGTSSSGGATTHRNTRLMYVQRSVLSGTVEGQHEFNRLHGTSLEWKLTRSQARRQQPDRREYNYDRFVFEGDPTVHWYFASLGSREYGDLRDDGWGATLNGAMPYRLGAWGRGKLTLGFDRQTKKRDNFYRRLKFTPNENVRHSDLPPDSIFAAGGFDGTPSTGFIEDVTNNTLVVGLDNYRADQRMTAGYVNVDVPFGARVRANVGVRVERGYQDVRSFALFKPQQILSEGRLDSTDWLPSGNITWAFTDLVNVRFAASRTVSRPDLNEMSPSPFLEYVGGMLIKGNPELKRAAIDNYDVRVEAFPGLSEVLAAGFFYKRLHQPIEQVIRGGTPHLLQPFNSDEGRNLGVELEARAGLARVWSRLKGLSISSNASLISSDVRLPRQSTILGSMHHPLQGQANYLVNAALGYAARGGRSDASIMVSAVGKRLYALGSTPLPDIYEQPVTTLDATLNVRAYRGARLKFGAKNLLDPRIRQLQDGQEVSAYYKGRSYSLALSYGS